MAWGQHCATSVSDCALVLLTAGDSGCLRWAVAGPPRWCRDGLAALTGPCVAMSADLGSGGNEPPHGAALHRKALKRGRQTGRHYTQLQKPSTEFVMFVVIPAAQSAAPSPSAHTHATSAAPAAQHFPSKRALCSKEVRHG